MRFIPVDTGSFTSCRALGVNPKPGPQGTQKESRDGVPQWVVEVLVGVDGRHEVVNVNVTEPVVPVLPEGELEVQGLRAMFWENGDRSGISFLADGLAAVGGQASRKPSGPSEPAKAGE